MELTRRDALAALAGTGIVGGGAAATVARSGNDDPERPGAADQDESVLASLVAAARVLYPSEVSGIEPFVRTYSLRRFDARPEYGRGVREAVAVLDDHARAWYGADFRGLGSEDRDELLRSMGVETADPDRDGTAAERVRFFVVNELLYALYTSPTGGTMVGIENPQGHPGGTESYREEP
jgi:hypothetical protein